MQHDTASARDVTAHRHAPTAPRERPLRFFVGTCEISGFTYEIADGLARLGHEVNTGLRMAGANFADRLYDIDLCDDVGKVDWAALAAEARDGTFHAPRRFSRRGSATDRMRWIIAHLQ